MVQKLRHWWFNRRWQVRYGVYATLLIAGFYGIEDFRAWSAWERHLGEIHVSAEDLDLPKVARAEYAPPDSNSFGESRFFREYLESPKGTFALDIESIPDFDTVSLNCLSQSGIILPNNPQFEVCFPTAAPALAGDEAARRLISLFNQWDDELSAFAESANADPDPINPQPILSISDYAHISFLELPPTKETADAIKFLTIAQLYLGRSDEAFENIRNLLKFSRNLARGETLIRATLALVLTHHIRQAIWYGLSIEAWNEEQLIQLSKDLETLQPLRWEKWGIWAEREQFLPLLRRLENGPVQRFQLNRQFEFFTVPYYWKFPASLKPTGSAVSSALFAAVPNGWVLRNSQYYCEEIDFALALLNEENPHARKLISDAAVQHRNTQSGPYTFIAEVFAIGISASNDGVVRFETYARQLRLAVALELFRLETGSYPTQLEMIAPRFRDGLPLDLYSGQPFAYRLDSSGQPFFYSFGPDEIDDGGKPGMVIESGDIIWHYESSRALKKERKSP